MTASRAPRTPEQRQAQWTRSMVPGTLAGQVVNAFPIEPGPGRMLASQRAAGGFSGSGGAVLFYRDRFTATAGAQTLTLTYLPVSGSIHVYLNGIEQDEATDWTSSGRTLNVQTAMDARASDVIDIRYAYSAAVPLTIGSTVTGISRTSTQTGNAAGFAVTLNNTGVVTLRGQSNGYIDGTNDATSHALGVTANVGDVVVFMVSCNQTRGVATPSGLGTWTQMGVVTNGSGRGLRMWVCKVTTAGSTFALSSGNNYDTYIVSVWSGLDGTYTANSGSTASPPSTGTVTANSGNLVIGGWGGDQKNYSPYTDSPVAWSDLTANGTLENQNAYGYYLVVP